jgi:hypothetical protein
VLDPLGLTTRIVVALDFCFSDMADLAAKTPMRRQQFELRIELSENYAIMFFKVFC